MPTTWLPRRSSSTIHATKLGKELKEEDSTEDLETISTLELYNNLQKKKSLIERGHHNRSLSAPFALKRNKFLEDDANAETIVDTHIDTIQEQVIAEAVECFPNVSFRFSKEEKLSSTSKALYEAVSLHKEHKHTPKKNAEYLKKDTTLNPLPENCNEDELNVQFYLVLIEMGIKEKQRAAYEKFSNVQKWNFIINYRSKHTPRQKSAEQIVEDLNTLFNTKDTPCAHIKNKLIALRSSFFIETPQWLLNFDRLKGIDTLGFIITELYHREQTSETEEALHECILCLITYMKTAEGFCAVVRNLQILKIIAKLISADSKTIKICGDVLEILGVVALANCLGHQNSMEALLSLKGLRKEKYRFQHLMTLLDSGISTLELTCMQLINAIVNSKYLTVDMRMNLRNEFAAAGLLKKIEKLKKSESLEDGLVTHIAAWEKNSYRDIQIINERINRAMKELSHVDDVYSILGDLTGGFTANFALTNFVDPDGADVKVNCTQRARLAFVLALLEKIVRDGYDPDFACFHVDAEIFRLPMINEEKLKYAESYVHQLSEIFYKQTKLKHTEHKKIIDKLYLLDKSITENKKQLEELKNSNSEALDRSHLELLKRLKASCHTQRSRARILEEIINNLDKYRDANPDGIIRLGGRRSNEVENDPIYALREVLGLGPAPVPLSCKRTLSQDTSISIYTPPTDRLYSTAIATLEEDTVIKLDEEIANDEAPALPMVPPPPPPPPPPGSAHGDKYRKKPYKIVASTQLKRMNWSSVPYFKVKGSFWENVEEERFIDSINWNDLEMHFCNKKSHFLSNGEPENKLKETYIDVMDPKKSYNLSILLTNLVSKRTVQWVKERLLKCDTEEHPELSLSLLVAFKRWAPDEKEKEKLDTFEGDIEKLALSNRFMKEISKIKRFKERMNFIIMRREHNELHTKLEKWVECVTFASKELKTNKKFQKILEIILLLGNYMNSSFKNVRPSFGFQLSYLTSLSSVKSICGKKNLLNFLAETIYKDEELGKVFEEPHEHIKECADVHFHLLREDIKESNANLKLLKEELNILSKSEKEENDFFIEEFKKFFEHLKNNVEDLNSKYEEMLEVYNDVVAFYKYPEVASPEDFFGTIGKFYETLKRAHEENLKAAEDAKEVQKRKALRLARIEKQKLQKEESKKSGRTQETVEQSKLAKELLKSLRKAKFAQEIDVENNAEQEICPAENSVEGRRHCEEGQTEKKKDEIKENLDDVHILVGAMDSSEGDSEEEENLIKEKSSNSVELDSRDSNNNNAMEDTYIEKEKSQDEISKQDNKDCQNECDTTNNCNLNDNFIDNGCNNISNENAKTIHKVQNKRKSKKVKYKASKGCQTQ